MPYKKKLILLGSTAALLALIYILTIVFDPVRTNARNERFTWLPSASREEADRIEIIRGGEKLELFLKGGAWYALLGAFEIPVKQGRIDDLMRLLSTRGAFPRRGSTSASHAELGLDGSCRLIIRGGAGIPLLDLLVGKEDPSGRGIFLRMNGENEFRSGDRLIGSYVLGETSSWLDMKLFEDKSVSLVQRVEVHYFDYYGMGEEISSDPYMDYTITRSGEEWILNGINPNKDRAENWMRAILDVQGENILAVTNEINDELINIFYPAARITIELGDGSVLELQIEKPDEEGKSLALAGGKPYFFIFSQWTNMRLLRDRDFFIN